MTANNDSEGKNGDLPWFWRILLTLGGLALAVVLIDRFWLEESIDGLWANIAPADNGNGRGRLFLRIVGIVWSGAVMLLALATAWTFFHYRKQQKPEEFLRAMTTLVGALLTASVTGLVGIVTLQATARLRADLYGGMEELNKKIAAIENEYDELYLEKARAAMDASTKAMNAADRAFAGFEQVGKIWTTMLDKEALEKLAERAEIAADYAEAASREAHEARSDAAHYSGQADASVREARNLVRVPSATAAGLANLEGRVLEIEELQNDVSDGLRKTVESGVDVQKRMHCLGTYLRLAQEEDRQRDIFSRSKRVIFGGDGPNVSGDCEDLLREDRGSGAIEASATGPTASASPSPPRSIR